MPGGDRRQLAHPGPCQSDCTYARPAQAQPLRNLGAIQANLEIDRWGMPQRTYKPDVERIDRLRLKKGWALPDLAAKACVSNRTIDGIMKGNEVVISTLRKVARALEVSPDTLIAGGGDIEENPYKGGMFKVAFRIDVRIVDGIPLDVKFEDFDETTDLLAFLDKLTKLIAPLAGPVEVVGVSPSSVLVIVEMTQIDILSVLELYVGNNLQLHNLFQAMQILATEEEFLGKQAGEYHRWPRALFAAGGRN